MQFYFTLYRLATIHVFSERNEHCYASVILTLSAFSHLSLNSLEAGQFTQILSVFNFQCNRKGIKVCHEWIFRFSPLLFCVFCKFSLFEIGWNWSNRCPTHIFSEKDRCHPLRYGNDLLNLGVCTLNNSHLDISSSFITWPFQHMPTALSIYFNRHTISTLLERFESNFGWSIFMLKLLKQFKCVECVDE